MWKVIGWVLAAIGTVVVVGKAAPWIVEQVKKMGDDRDRRALPGAREPRRLGAGPAPASSASPGSPMVGRGPTLVSCGLGGSPAPAGSSPADGLQSSAIFRWCYVVRHGDSAGSIAEAITGDSARYIELLVANPTVPKKGKMGVVVGSEAWDFADGALSDGTMILVSQTMNAWVDQRGVAAGGYLPYPPDPKDVLASDVASDEPTGAPPAGTHTSGNRYEGYSTGRSGEFPPFAPPPPDMSDDGDGQGGSGGGEQHSPPAAPTTATRGTDGASGPVWGDGFDYLGGA